IPRSSLPNPLPIRSGIRSDGKAARLSETLRTCTCMRSAHSIIASHLEGGEIPTDLGHEPTRTVQPRYKLSRVCVRHLSLFSPPQKRSRSRTLGLVCSAFPVPGQLRWGSTELPGSAGPVAMLVRV